MTKFIRVNFFLRIALLFAPLAVLHAAEPPKTPPMGPNIVVFLVDDMNWDYPGFNDGPCETPNLDRLAKESTRLTQFYVHSVCSPTRAALLTGRHPFRNGMEERSHGNDTAGMLPDEPRSPKPSSKRGTTRSSSANGTLAIGISANCRSSAALIITTAYTVIAALKAKGVLDNTLIVFFNDNGGTNDNLPFRTSEMGEMSICKGSWKLVGKALYDLSNDPGETTDLAAKHPDILQELNARIQQLVAERRAPEKHLNIPDKPLVVFGEEENANPPTWLQPYLDSLPGAAKAKAKQE